MAEVIDLDNKCRMTRTIKVTSQGDALHVEILSEGGDAIWAQFGDLTPHQALVIAESYMRGFRTRLSKGMEIQRERIRDALGIPGVGW